MMSLASLPSFRLYRWLFEVEPRRKERNFAKSFAIHTILDGSDPGLSVPGLDLAVTRPF